jgi:glycosyltransferase involved in cell wall biosynthesis
MSLDLKLNRLENESMKYSVIIPTYNYGHYLPQSLQSALNQTVPANEIIIVDGGSTDNTPEVIKPYLTDARIKYIRTENLGVSAARNTGIELAQSELIAFLDADDIWVHNKLELQLPLFNNSRVGVVYSLRQPFNEKGLINNFEHVEVFRGLILPYLIEHNFICLSSAVVRRASLDTAGLFDTRLSQGEDMDLWLRIAAEEYEFDYVNQPLVSYRQGGLASNPSQWDKRYKENKSMLENYFSNPKYKRKVSNRMRRQAWAALWRKRGAVLFEQGRRLQALKYGLGSLFYVPVNKSAWHIVAKSLLPLRVVRLLREK